MSNFLASTLMRAAAQPFPVPLSARLLLPELNLLESHFPAGCPRVGAVPVSRQPRQPPKRCFCRQARSWRQEQPRVTLPRRTSPTETAPSAAEPATAQILSEDPQPLSAPSRKKRRLVPLLTNSSQFILLHPPSSSEISLEASGWGCRNQRE